MIQPSKIMFWDLETDNHFYHGAVASPKHPDNYVVMNGYAVEEEPYSGEVKFDYYSSKEQAKGWLKIPDDVWLVVAHNLPFELDWAYTQCYDELMKFMKRGGRFWCTAYAEYRLSRQRELYPSLNEVCVKYGGNTKLDLVAVEWSLGKLTSQIDHDLLRDYLIGFDTADGFQEGDIGNTRLAFYGQYEQVVERGMLDIMFALMDALVFNSVCMSNGLHIDREYAFKRKEELEQRLQELEEHINSLRGNIPEEFRDQFNPNSMYHMSAWLFGGAVNFQGREETFKDDGTPKWEKKSVVYNLDRSSRIDLEPTLEGVEDIEEVIKLKKVLLCPPNFEPMRYKSGKNKGKIKVERIDSDVRATRLCKVAVDIVGLINLEDYPQEFMSDFLKDYTTKLELADGKPVISTGAEAIEMLLNFHATPASVKPLLEVLNEKATVDKILGDYFLVERFNKDGELNFKETKGALKYLTDNDLVHHSLNATSTVTGRLSCTKPNYQTLTDKLDVKTMFTSRFGDKGRMVEIDYENLEVITLANFSKDEFLMRQITENMNAHDINSAWKLGITYEEFYQVYRIEGKTHPLWKQYEEVRDEMKNYEFLYNYGGTAKGLVFNYGCPLEEAEAFIQHKEESLKGVTLFFDGVEKSIRDSAVNVREMRDDRWQLAQEGMYKADGGLEYSYKTSTMYKWERGQKITYQDFKIPQIKNYLIQGESSVMVQVGTGRIIRYLFSQNFFDGKMLPVHTTHDSISLDVHEDVLDKLKNIVYIMEGVNEWMKPLGYDLPLPYPVEATVGMNMQDQQVVN